LAWTGISWLFLYLICTFLVASLCAIYVTKGIDARFLSHPGVSDNPKTLNPKPVLHLK
jgi:hypothetical protein